MKKFWKISGITVLSLLVLMIILPFAFKGKIVELIKTEINNSVNAKVDFEDFSLSLFRSFPNFNFGISGLTIIGVDEFSGDTLANIGSLYLELDLMSVFSGDNYSIKSIVVKDPVIRTIILADGKANYDIAKASSDSTVVNANDTSKFSLNLKSFKFVNAKIIYDDREGNMYADIQGLDLNMNGDFTSSTTDINLESEIEALTYKMDGMKYLNKATVKFDANIGANLDNWEFTFKDNNLLLNSLGLKFEGKIKMPTDDYDIDLKFASDKADFKSFLSLVPAIYLTDFENIKTSGKASVSGKVKGIYNDLLMPSFDIKIDVSDGMFQYPDLPAKVENVNIKAEINSPESDMDKMKIDVEKFHFDIAKNPMDIRLKLTTPMSDPNIDANFKGKFDLATLKTVYPLDKSQNLIGNFDVNVALKGKQSSLDKGNYQEFVASGFMKIMNFEYKDKDLPEGVQISNTEMNFNPKTVELTAFKAKYMGSEIESNGSLSNYIDYAFGDGTLKGVLNLKSGLLDINKILGTSSDAPEKADTANKNSSMEAFQVPKNIDFAMNATIGRLIYDNINISSIYGKVVLANSMISLDNLNMDMLGGKLNMSGLYNSTNIQSPEVALVLGMSNFDVKKSYEAFNTIKNLAPIAKYINGTFSSIVNFNSKLDKNMNPIYKSLNSNGLLKFSNLAIKGSPTFSKIATALKYDKLNNLDAKPFNLQFDVVDGNLEVKPFNVIVNEIPTNVSGTMNIDQTIDYKLAMELPKAKLGSGANSALNNLSNQAKSIGVNVDNSDVINVNAYITGKAIDPKVKIAIANPAQDVKDQLEKQVKNEIDKAKKQALDEANKLKQQAEDKALQLKKQAEEEAIKAKQKAIDNAKSELEKQKLELEKKKLELEQKKKEEADKLKKKLADEAKNKLKGWR